MQIKAAFRLQDMIFVGHGEDTIVLILDADIQVDHLPHAIGTEEALSIEDPLHRHNIENDVIREVQCHKDLEYIRNLQMIEVRQEALKRLLILIHQKKLHQRLRWL